ncbi:MAG: sugar phosphate isomerase/epimerase, partial [Oscillospiraceae bacterium]|nr:sugar phosphate isomerase/epimerase [Oscillospiraceae bacterium]
MVLGIINGWEEGHFKAVHKLGLKAVEFCINHNYDSFEVLSKADEIRANSEKYGIKIGAIGRWGMERIDNNGDVIPEALEHDKNLIKLAAIVGCPVFNCGCNEVQGKSFYENCLIAINYFGLLLDYARDKNVKIAVYNCDWANFVYNDKAWNIVLGALPELGIKFDSSHSINRNEDYLKVLCDWKERVYHVHIKGNLNIAGETYDDSPAGLDTTKWPAIMSLLYIANYNGMLSIEPHSRNWRGDKGQWGVEYTINYMKQFIMPEDYSSE